MKWQVEISTPALEQLEKVTEFMVDRFLSRYYFVQEVMHGLEGYTCRTFAQHEHFGGDAQGDFVGRFGSEVKADGRVNLGELFTCDAIF